MFFFFKSVVYLDIGANPGDTADLNFSFNGDANRLWDIKVTQYECGHPFELVADDTFLLSRFQVGIFLTE